MDFTFLSDNEIFQNDFSYLIKLREKPKLLESLEKKHKGEILDNISLEDKKNSLIIWNAIYTREVSSCGILKKYLHPIYNDFYRKIPKEKSLKNLQKLEIEMMNTYIDLLIYDVEIKDTFVVNRILKYLHLHIESPISIKLLSKELNLSEGYIQNSFKNHMGITIMKYVKNLKIERAKMLLKTSQMSILEIGETLCFHDQSHFTKTFKEIVGVSPLKYRNLKD